MKLHKSTTSIRLALFVVVVTGLIFSGWLWWKDALSPVDSRNHLVEIFVVKRGDGVKAIATRLSQQHLIRSSIGFFLMVKLMGIDSQLQAGDFRLTRAMDAPMIARELTHGVLDAWVTVLEGWRVEEIAGKLAKELDIPESEFLRYAKEGYMFPDTYLIPREATAAAIAQIFVDNFEKRFTPQMHKDVFRRGLTLNDIVTLASIIEREGKNDEDRPIIAGILLKRLQEGWPLQVDATLQYVLGYQANQKTWWKKGLTDEDKKIRSSYNTYLHNGLPPGPIANPGLASLRAVIYPKETSYWYYLHDTVGKAHFAKTIEDHNINIAKYLN